MADYDVIWAKTAEAARQVMTAPAVYRALERAVPVAWEDGVLAVGFGHGDGAHAGTLNTADYALKIEQLLRQATGVAGARVRVIDGTTPADWEAAKHRDAVLDQRRVAATQKKAIDPAAASSWEAIADQISQLWTDAPFRTMPSGKGRFLQTVLEMIDQAMESLGPVNEGNERAFSRVLERIGGMTGADPAVLAYLLYERRRQRGAD